MAPAENEETKAKKEKPSKEGGKHQSVLQTKLTTLAIQIGYAGNNLDFLHLQNPKINFFVLSFRNHCCSLYFSHALFTPGDR